MKSVTNLATRFDLSEALKHLSHWLPSQAPIKDFIHHNTLHAFQDRNFHEGLRAASRLFGSNAYLEIAWYQKAYREGRITDAALERVFQANLRAPEERANTLQRMLEPAHGQDAAPAGVAVSGIRSQWAHKYGVDIDLLIQPILFRLVGNFLDQGVAIWRMPHAHETLWESVGRIVRESWLPVSVLSDRECKELLAKTPDEAIAYCLSQLVGSELHYEQYLLEMLLAHPGWSGMVYMVETNPGTMIARRKITLRDFVALQILLEFGWTRRKLGSSFKPLVVPGTSAPDPVTTSPAPLTTVQWLQQLWQEAFEWSLYEDVLNGLEKNFTRKKSTPPTPKVRAFFCIDDRESSVRRYLEELDPEIETVATAGFFGIDFLFQGLYDAYPVQHCPVIIRPKHLIREVPAEPEKYKKPRLAQLLHFTPSSNTLFRGWIITQTLGVWTALRLAINVFQPSLRPPTEKKLSEVKTTTKLNLLRVNEEPTPDGYLLGYSIPEMADRVFGVFRSTGMMAPFPDLLVFVAHGSSSVNNPHFAAYDCGACSGRPGAPNSRAFAQMANDPAVRKLLRERGLDIPDGCRIVGSLHDTARDEVTYFDTAELSTHHRSLLDGFRKTMEEALKSNAKERCRRFELVDTRISPEDALTHVRQRAASIFEPRPELNHATNALAIVGRRGVTRGVFLDRRPFLNSYDPTQDASGDILSGILNAVIPVCGGINLEYFFSRVDNSVYGAGTKLPHNVVGLFGVSNGVEGDLRTGLPSQMIEVHDPVRLLVIVEQEPEIAFKAVTKNPAVFEWVKNDWVKYACISPSTGKVSIFDKGEMVSLVFSRPAIPSRSNSLSVVEGHRGNIAVHFIEKEQR